MTMPRTHFRWGLWGSLVGLLAVGGAVVAFTRGPSVTYDNPTSPRPVKGKSGAAVVVQEFSDFQCPACAATAPFLNDLVERYASDIELAFKHFPLTQIHANAYNAALASECANDQGKFWEYHDVLFANQSALGVSDLKQYAADLGMQAETFAACLDTRAEKSIVDADVAEANQKQVPGTPTFFVNGTMTDTSGLETAIKSALGGAVQGPVR